MLTSMGRLYGTSQNSLIKTSLKCDTYFKGRHKIKSMILHSMNRCLLNKPDNDCVHLIFKRILKRSAAMITEKELSKNK